MRLRLVAAQPVAHPMVNHLLILAALHVDEIADDESADVAETKLARNFVDGFEVGLENRFLDVAAAFVATGVHVDGNKRVNFIDHDVAAAL